MLEIQRKQEIVNRIRRQGFVSTAQRMKELNTSRSSIMRDLSVLEQEGVLIRTHGGASLPTVSFEREIPVSDKQEVHAREKNEIARAAAATVRASESIYVDTGSTPVYMLKYLMGKSVTIITSSVYLIRHLPYGFDGSVYLLGGRYEEKYDMNLGASTVQDISRFNYDRAFFSANGISGASGEVMVCEPDVAGVKMAVMKRSSRNILIADSSKFYTTAVWSYANVDEFDEIYSDRGVPEEYRYDNMILTGVSEEFEDENE